MKKIYDNKVETTPIFKQAQKLAVIELFAGIGSYAEALRRNQIEYELNGISEINKFAIEAYKELHATFLTSVT